MFVPSLCIVSLLAGYVPPERRTAVVEVAEKAGAAVVNISAQYEHRTRNPFSRRSRGLDQFFRDFFEGSRAPQESRPDSLGSGVIIDKSGLVLTNEHVVSRASKVTIALRDRRSFEVDVVAADPVFDIAVLKVRGGRDLPSVELGSSDDLMTGETVIAIGNPFGLSNTVTTGVVSALHRSVNAEEKTYEDFIQTDAAINPGNSGGALLNIEGKLIGINTAIYQSANGIGFAIPVDKAVAVVEEVLKHGEVRPVFIGVSVERGGRSGALVRKVFPKSAAESVGVRPGDRIVDLGGTQIEDGRDFSKAQRGLVPGQKVDITFTRGHQKLKRSLVAHELALEQGSRIGRERLGIEVSDKGRNIIISKVDPKSDAAAVGIRPGDLLLSVAGRRLSSVREFKKLCSDIRDADAVAVIIGRGGRAYYVTLSLGSG